MDSGGSYGNVFGGRTPMSPAAPTATNEQYKVNVSRQKTKKWANFKPANYDGDDWGADYDDAPEDDAPPPPPPSSMKPGSSRLPSGPAVLSSRQFTPLGGPPQLHLQTSRAVSTPAGPVSAGGLLEQTASKPVASPLSAMPQSAIPAASMPSGPLPSLPSVGAPLPSRSKTPIVSQSAGPVPNVPPPTLPQLATTPRPESSVEKTQTEARLASPVNTKSPVTSPVKPLPFVRPADIYRRMEEAKEKERLRQSIDSAERPSFDTGKTPPTIRQGPQPTTPTAPKVEGEKEESKTQTKWNDPPSLPLVMERRSEYGLEGLLASYGSEESVNSLAPAPEHEAAASKTTKAKASDQPKSNPGIASEPERARESAQSNTSTGEKLRPSSTSPKLPELGRLSVFGADFFSVTSDLSSAPPMPSFTSNFAANMKSRDSSGLVSPSAETANNEKGNRTAQEIDVIPQEQATVAAVRPGAPPNGHVDAIRSVTPPSHQTEPANEPTPSNPQQQDAAMEASRQAASSVQDKQRPTLPGTWVTETLATPAVTPSSADLDKSLSQNQGSKLVAASPATEPHDEADRSIKAIDDSQPPELNGMVDLTVKKQNSPTPCQQDSMMALPPLKTPGPASAAVKPGIASQAAPPILDKHASAPPQLRDDATGQGSTSPEQSPAASRYLDIAPTAPLKPGRGAQSAEYPEGLAPPPSFDTGVNLDTTNSSPVKESDMLREEIMKSLSPLSPSAEFQEHTRGTTSTYHSVPLETVRESSYLGDVYDDYWGSNDDKPELALPTSQTASDPVKKQGSDNVPVAPLELASQSPKPLSLSPRQGATALVASTAPVERTVELRRRFSWETGGAKTPAPTASPVRTDPPTASPQKETPPAAVVELAAAPMLVAGQAPLAGGISHQVSNASTVPPGAKVDAPAEPPSPISVRSGDHDHQTENRRQSLAEQKSLVQTSSNPVSPSPPLDQHPAIAQDAPRPPPSTMSPVVPSKPEAFNIMTFRQIMDLPSPLERAKQFNETRFQFAALDTGLEEWMLSMQSRHAEHASATSSFQDGFMTAGIPGEGQSEVLNPYTTHHANASVAGFGHASKPSANIPMPPTMPHGSSPFGHSGAQVGVKSKKLLMAAGKAGKGLLSKGRNKLSATVHNS